MHLRFTLLLVLACAPACGSSVPVVLEAPHAPDASTRVSLAVGDLLSADPARSAAAERRLLALDEEERAALVRHAARIATERDPRWLHVLDEAALLPALSPGERTAFLLWKAQRPEPSFAMRAQAGLVEQARQDPRPLLAELARGTPAVDALVAALVVAERRDVVPALTQRYLATDDEDERRELAEALASLVGEDLRPRPSGSPEQRAGDAEALLKRWRSGPGPGSTP